MMKIIVLLAALPVFAAIPANAQLSARYSGYSEGYYQGLRFGLFTPAGHDAQKSYPLIVYLHGSGDTVSRDNRWYRDSIQRKYPAFVLTPKCVESDQGWGNTWQEGHSEATAKTLALVDSLMAEYNIDTDRLYLYGISMGGFGVFSILSKEKGKFAAAYAVCGGSDAGAAPNLLDVPIWIFHGESDDVVPVRLSRGIYQEIVRLGGTKAKYTEYPGVRHNSWENVEREKHLAGWLFAQRLDKRK